MKPYLLLCLLLPVIVQAQPARVRAVPLEALIIQVQASAPAAVVSLSDSRIGAQISAPVESVPVRVGEVVEAGASLVTLDCDDYQLAVEELQARLAAIEARLTFARQQVERARSLARVRTIPEEQREQREAEQAALSAERQAAQASLAAARRKLDKCEVRSPFRAVVMERLIGPGEYAAPGTPLVRVLDLEHLEVSAQVLAGDSGDLESADRVVFRHQGRDYPLDLRTISPVIDPISRTREARLLFADQAAPPGASGRLVWMPGPALPADLLVRRDEQLGVLLARDGRAVFHSLPDAREGRPAWINLPGDTLVITEGRFALAPDDPIEPAAGPQEAD
ncbi:MAG: efflux RND transporter periplasmic adaptor subunit [Candidatus Competibacteraceae bacterium]|nr:efflux RND transporter periplasmic adaptor subunit [Candidatus Competibacteraceae bacterium]